jgi:hypothetical protein
MPMLGSPEREHPATSALRSGSIDELTRSLATDLDRTPPSRDPRDVMLHLTPYHDAARRLGADAAAVFDAAAAGASAAIGDVARTFGRRREVTLGAMGWRLEETPDGPAYRFAWPRWDPPKRREPPRPTPPAEGD